METIVDLQLLHMCVGSTCEILFGMADNPNPILEFGLILSYSMQFSYLCKCLSKYCLRLHILTIVIPLTLSKL